MVSFSNRSFTTVLESAESAKRYNQADLALTLQNSVYDQVVLITEHQSRGIFSSQPAKQKWDQNGISCGNKTKHSPSNHRNPQLPTKIIPGETLF